jgi:uncharacterized protein with ParB-like and HNH nuclease domain
MQVNKQSIYQFLEGSGKTFVIPVYQRDYAWKTENCQKLWQDLLDLENTQKTNHFLGTIVNIYDKQDARLIVDGQQRLTTVSLLLLALENYLKEKVKKNQEESILQDQLLEFLINKYSLDRSKRIRLKPNKQDQDYFNQLFEDPKNTINDSNIVRNYNFFYEKLINLEIEPITLFSLFRKLEIVNIELERQFDDPQLIFESLNSTGVDLTDGDLIRNYILMDLEPIVQEKLYTDYWVKIEKLSLDTAEFIRNFLMFKLSKNVTQTKRAVYTEFKKYTQETFNKDAQKTLEELLEFAQIYSYFIRQNNHPNKDIDKSLDRLFKLEFRVAYPFLLDVFVLFKEGFLKEKIVYETINLIQNYAFRKIIVDNTTQGLNKLFLTLAKEIKKLEPENWQSQYFEILKFILKSKTASQRFPTDEDFVDALCEKEIYKLRSKNRDFLLQGLENYNNAYSVVLEDLTVEHILPQNASKWSKDLGHNWQDIRDKYVHTLGNLTLTAQNSKLSNKDFQSKQDIDFHTSKLKLSYKLGDQEIWNDQTILERSQKLANEAIQIWQYPVTKYQSSIEENEVYTLDEEVDFKYKKIKKIIIQDQELEVKNWWFAMENLCKYLYNQSPTEFKNIITNSEISRFFSKSPELLNGPMDLFDGWYIDCGRNTNSNVRLMAKLCDLLGFDKTDIQVEIN